MDRAAFTGGKPPVLALLTLTLTFCQPTLAAPVNKPPVISGTPPASATVGVPYVFQPTASDPEGRVLTFGVNNRPSWAVFSSETGRLSGTPALSGTHSNIRIWVSDSKFKASLPPSSIVVAAASDANRPPIINGTPETSVTLGQAYTFTPSASDPEGQTLTFSIANRPTWATFSTTTGQLSGTPTVAGTSSNILIAVSDGAVTAALATFSITAQAVANRPPLIGGAPVTSASVGQPYSFRPTATDADGDPLTFVIGSKPAWATFDTSDGTLYGTPTSSGTFASIVIGVSDGQAIVSLPAFAIGVAASPLTSATVRWTAPTANTDGSPIAGLSGYRVFAGTTPGQYSQNVSIPDPAVTTVVLEGLASGNIWYFAVTAVNSAGLESAYSQEVSVNRL